MKPTPALSRLKTRIPFTTKNVGKGFYRGSNVGSLGAHTNRGHYLIDYRKTRHFVVPNLQNNELTPFVSGKMERKQRKIDPFGGTYDQSKINGMQYLKWWKEGAPHEYSNMLQQERALQEQQQEQQMEFTHQQEAATSTQNDPAR